MHFLSMQPAAAHPHPFQNKELSEMVRVVLLQLGVLLVSPPSLFFHLSLPFPSLPLCRCRWHFDSSCRLNLIFITVCVCTCVCFAMPVMRIVETMCSLISLGVVFLCDWTLFSHLTSSRFLVSLDVVHLSQLTRFLV
jgi:hypothetical protein